MCSVVCLILVGFEDFCFSQHGPFSILEIGLPYIVMVAMWDVQFTLPKSNLYHNSVLPPIILCTEINMGILCCKWTKSKRGHQFVLFDWTRMWISNKSLPHSPPPHPNKMKLLGIKHWNILSPLFSWKLLMNLNILSVSFPHLHKEYFVVLEGSITCNVFQTLV